MASISMQSGPAVGKGGGSVDIRRLFVQPAGIGRWKVRAFLAIEIDSEIRHSLEEVQKCLRRAGVQGVAWVQPDALHLTLQFLGEISRERCGELQACLRAAPLPHPFSLSVRGVGAFPSPLQARVLWAGISAGVPLDELVRTVRTRVQECAIDADTKPFSPHITLGRIRHPRRDEGIKALLMQCGAALNAEIPVHSFVLIKSRLTSRGPIYDVIERFSLESSS